MGGARSKLQKWPARIKARSHFATEDSVGESNTQYILGDTGKMTDLYDVEKRKIGGGSYGTVNKARNKVTQVERAVKTLSKSMLKNIERFRQEIAIMKMMDHQNIIKLYETFEDPHNVYLVMEYCQGGGIFDAIIESGHFKEMQAATLMQQITRAIHFMHACHVCHRDIKPENFLFMSKGSIDNNVLKIIDFGLSCKFEHGRCFTTKAGTPYYVAPQVLSGNYDQLCDIWSCGVIMYIMLCGYPPFFGETDAEVLSKVRLGNFSFMAADWKNVTQDAKNLIRMMLKLNPHERCSADQVLNHDWIKNRAPKAMDMELSNLVDNLRSFRSRIKLKKLALHILAVAHLDDCQINMLEEGFLQLDSSGSGVLTAEELQHGIEQVGLKRTQELQEHVEGTDSDGSGLIDYTEFLHFLRNDIFKNDGLRRKSSLMLGTAMDMSEENIDTVMNAKVMKKFCDEYPDEEPQFRTMPVVSTT